MGFYVSNRCAVAETIRHRSWQGGIFIFTGCRILHPHCLVKLRSGSKWYKRQNWREAEQAGLPQQADKPNVRRDLIACRQDRRGNSADSRKAEVPALALGSHFTIHASVGVSLSGNYIRPKCTLELTPSLLQMSETEVRKTVRLVNYLLYRSEDPSLHQQYPHKNPGKAVCISTQQWWWGWGGRSMGALWEARLAESVSAKISETIPKNK